MQILNHELFDDLKCCGNCRHRSAYEREYEDGFEEYCTHGIDREANCICPKWEYDNLKKADRMV